MQWVNIDSLRSPDASSNFQSPNLQSNNQLIKPPQRWGQACVTANNKLYILGGYDGQYLGDLWEFNFEAMNFAQVTLEGSHSDLNSLSRSNHTAVYYSKHNAIYVFGGGQVQKQRFNDVIKIAIEDPTRRGNPVAKVSKVVLNAGSPIPTARTYHASCLVGKYMVVIGGEANSDLKDFWALDLDQMQWFKPDVNFINHYSAKRFHTVSCINDTQVITFGGCHSEYVHLNEMHIFDMASFLATPTDPEAKIECKKIEVTQGLPSTRWGHASTVLNGKLYIVGGRNEQDVIDLHEFDPVEMKWRELEITGIIPKPRRRHSALFVSSSLVMFGGFDGNFYNDLNIMDLNSNPKTQILVSPSTISQDYLKMLDCHENHDLVFVVEKKQKVYASKGLVLFRLMFHEFNGEVNEEKIQHYVQTYNPFIGMIYNASPNQQVILDKASKQVVLDLLEFLYCDKFVERKLVSQVQNLANLCQTLSLFKIQKMLLKMINAQRQKIHHNMLKSLQKDEANVQQQYSSHQNKTIVQKAQEAAADCEAKVALDFSQEDDILVQSPEDRQSRLHNKALDNMNQCKNLDLFYDLVFEVEGTLIKANSLVLQTRCEYFQSMLSAKYRFRESTLKRDTGCIKVGGVPRQYFSCIIQYIYSDHFFISNHDLEFFLKLLTFADYFILPRLVEICSSYLKNFINAKTALHILLVAHSHNASQLESFCVNYIVSHENEIMNGKEFKTFKRRAQDKLLQVIEESLAREKEESFVQMCISNFKSQRPTDSRQNNSSLENLDKEYETQIDFDSIASGSQYIFLEEHHKVETYNETLLKQLESQRPSDQEFKPQTQRRQKFHQQEEEKTMMISNAHEQRGKKVQTPQGKNLFYFNEKENSHPNVPAVASKGKLNFYPLGPQASTHRLHPNKQVQKRPVPYNKKNKRRGNQQVTEEISDEEFEENNQ